MVRLRATLLALVAVACGSSTEEPQPYPVVWSWSTASTQSVELRFLLPVSTPNCQTDSVSVTGPGLNAPLQLACMGVTGVAFAGTVNLSASGRLPPLTYTFAATLGGKTGTHDATVNCYLGLPTGLDPTPPVKSPVTLSWSRPSSTGVPAPPASTRIQYGVSVSGPDPKSVSVVDQLSTTVNLAIGTYSWGVEAVPVGLYDGSSALRCGSEWNAGSFTVQ